MYHHFVSFAYNLNLLVLWGLLGPGRLDIFAIVKIVPDPRIWARIFVKTFLLGPDTLNFNSVQNLKTINRF